VVVDDDPRAEAEGVHRVAGLLARSGREW
jgi:hypothetical protein